MIKRARKAVHHAKTKYTAMEQKLMEDLEQEELLKWLKAHPARRVLFRTAVGTVLVCIPITAAAVVTGVRIARTHHRKRKVGSKKNTQHKR